MTFKEIRSYATVSATNFAKCVRNGDGKTAQQIEDHVIEMIGRHLGGAFHPERKQQYLAKKFVEICRLYHVSTRVIHLTKNGEVK